MRGAYDFEKDDVRDLTVLLKAFDEVKVQGLNTLERIYLFSGLTPKNNDGDLLGLETTLGFGSNCSRSLFFCFFNLVMRSLEFFKSRSRILILFFKALTLASPVAFSLSILALILALHARW